MIEANTTAAADAAPAAEKTKSITLDDAAGTLTVRELAGTKDQAGADCVRVWTFSNLSQAAAHAPMFADFADQPAVAEKIAAVRVAGKAESDARDAAVESADAAREGAGALPAVVVVEQLDDPAPAPAPVMGGDDGGDGQAPHVDIDHEPDA